LITRGHLQLLQAGERKWATTKSYQTDNPLLSSIILSPLFSLVHIGERERGNKRTPSSRIVGAKKKINQDRRPHLPRTAKASEIQKNQVKPKAIKKYMHRFRSSQLPRPTNRNPATNNPIGITPFALFRYIA